MSDQTIDRPRVNRVIATDSGTADVLQTTLNHNGTTAGRDEIRDLATVLRKARHC